jgi:hypothetical protein
VHSRICTSVGIGVSFWLLASVPFVAFAGEPAWWTNQKARCGLDSKQAYNSWNGQCNSSSGGGLSGGGASSNQQLMLGLAGALGTAFGNALREQEANRAQARQEEMERAAEAMALFQAAEQVRLKELEARHQKLLSNLKGGLGNTELGLKRYGSGTLELKSGSKLFGEPNATGPFEYGKETAGLTLKMPEAPPTPAGKLVDGATMDKAWQDYYQASDKAAEADARRQKLEDEKKLAERIKKEAEKKLAELKQQAAQQAASIPKDQPAKQEEKDKLAEAEKLLNQATDLDNKATQDLDKAQQDVKQAKLDLDRTEKERTKAEKGLAQAEQGQTTK